MIKELYEYREMIYSLVRKDLRGRYKNSALGFLWTFLNPLLQLAVYSAVFSVILRSGIDKYYLFLFVALIPWIFFSSAITGGSVSIITQKDLVTKIYFPNEVIPLSYVTSCFVNMLLCFVVVIVVVIVSGVKLSPLGLLCLPLVMVIEYLLALGIAMISSALTVYFRDLEHILTIIAMAWMYLTPVVYDLSICPEEYVWLMHLNPMTSIITAYRDILYYGTVPDMSTLIEAVVLGLIFLLVGCFVFSKLKKRFAEVL